MPNFVIMETKPDIRDINDIKLFVDEFYTLVGQDELLAPIFNFRLSSFWGPHLEIMCSFWNAALFGVKGYSGSPFMKHATMDLTDVHFDRWLGLFNATIDKYFLGTVADDAKRRALIMADMFASRLKENKGKSNIKPIF